VKIYQLALVLKKCDYGVGFEIIEMTKKMRLTFISANCSFVSLEKRKKKKTIRSKK